MQVNLLANPSPRLPIHPQPIQGESMESWIVRWADAIPCSPPRFIATYFKGSNAYFDLDLIHDNSDLFFRLAEVMAGGPALARKMTVFSFEHLFVQNSSRTSSWTLGSIHFKARRSCPTCLSEDTTPHLRLIWRLDLVSVCNRHGVMLKDKCDGCHADYRPYLNNPHFDFRRCRQCGFFLPDAPVDCADLKEDGVTAVSALSGLAQSGTLPNEMKWRYDIHQLFPTLSFVVSFLNMVDKKSESGLGDQRNRDKKPESHQKYILCGRAWRLLSNWQDLERLIGNYQSIFNQVVWRRRCPELLTPFKNEVRSYEVRSSKRERQETYDRMLEQFEARSKTPKECKKYLMSLGYRWPQAQHAVSLFFGKIGNTKSP